MRTLLGERNQTAKTPGFSVLSELKHQLGKAVTLLLCSSSKKRVEQGALADELSLLRYNNYQEANEENQTGLRDVLLPELALYL
jgi:hypothetical protein